jgi:hypothetical protein
MKVAKVIASNVLLLIVITAAFTGIAVYAVTLVAPGFTGQPARYVYTVKFICNVLGESTAVNMGLIPGIYYTDINIHNPSYQKANVTFVENFVLSDPSLHGREFPPNTQYFIAHPQPYALRTVTLGPNAATRIDCNDILNILSLAVGYNRSTYNTAIGFVELITTKPILSPGTMDVWVEYTAQSECLMTQPSCSSPPNLQVVQIQPSQYVP